MQTYDPTSQIGFLGLAEGERVRTHVGGTVAINAGYTHVAGMKPAFFSNPKGLTNLGTLQISIEGADDFDSFTLGNATNLRFSKGLEVGSKIAYLANGYAYSIGEIADGSSKSQLNIKLDSYSSGYGLTDLVNNIEYKNLADDTNYTASKKIRFHLKTDFGVELGAEVQLAVSNSNTITFYTRYDEHIIGTGQNDVFNLEHVNVNGSNNDFVDGLAGYDVLNVNSLQAGDLQGIRNIEQINGTKGYDDLVVSFEEFSTLQVVDLKDGGGIGVFGETIDLRGKTFLGVTYINVGSIPQWVPKSPGSPFYEAVYGSTTVITDSVAYAKKVSESTLGDAKLILTHGKLSSADRAHIYGNGIDKIVSYETPAYKDYFGSSKKNTLRGSSKDNVLNGGDGADTLYGKGGRDIFMFNSFLGEKNVDKIKDFNHKLDTIQLDHEIFLGLKLGSLSRSAFHIGTKAHDRSDRIIYDSASGKLYFDEDGTGRRVAVEFAVLDNKTQVLNHSDFYIV